MTQRILDEFTTAWNKAFITHCPNCQAQYSKRLIRCPECGEINPSYREDLEEAERVFERYGYVIARVKQEGGR